MKRFTLGLLLGLVVPALAVLAAAWKGWFSVRASAAPPAWESRLAGMARDAAVERQAPRLRNPIAPTDAELLAGLAIFRNDCAGCHGEVGRPSSWGRQFYPPVPQFGQTPPRKPDWQIFWIVQNGLRYSGMGGWKGQMSDADVWRVAAFLSRLESLPPAVEARWRSPSPAP